MTFHFRSVDFRRYYIWIKLFNLSAVWKMQLVKGLRVVRGPGWKWGEQDGGEGSVGTVVDIQKNASDSSLPISSRKSERDFVPIS